MNRKLLAITVSLIMLGCMLPITARADADNQAVLFSVNTPMKTPTAVLPPGRYEIKTLGDGSQVAEIWSAREKRFYGFVDTTPVRRAHALKSEVVLTRQRKAPEQLREWFYPGDRTGNKLLYPENHNDSDASTANAG